MRMMPRRHRRNVCCKCIGATELRGTATISRTTERGPRIGADPMGAWRSRRNGVQQSGASVAKGPLRDGAVGAHVLSMSGGAMRSRSRGPDKTPSPQVPRPIGAGPAGCLHRASTEPASATARPLGPGAIWGWPALQVRQLLRKLIVPHPHLACAGKICPVQYPWAQVW